MVELVVLSSGFSSMRMKRFFCMCDTFSCRGKWRRWELALRLLAKWALVNWTMDSSVSRWIDKILFVCVPHLNIYRFKTNNARKLCIKSAYGTWRNSVLISLSLSHRTSHSLALYFSLFSHFLRFSTSPLNDLIFSLSPCLSLRYNTSCTPVNWARFTSVYGCGTVCAIIFIRNMINTVTAKVVCFHWNSKRKRVVAQRQREKEKERERHESKAKHDTKQNESINYYETCV